jgi:cycloeucalenol cycloisomerase
VTPPQPSLPGRPCARTQFYHVLSNAALRRVRTGYLPGWGRFAFEAGLIAVLSYTTAFMESLTICGFPYYRFEDRDAAYTVGSAFYGIYFLVSFPAFARVDEDPKRPFTLAQACTEALAAGMAVLCLLDFARLALGVELFAPH